MPEITIRCCTDDHVLALETFEETPYLYLTFHIAEWYAQQRSFITTLKTRLARVFLILMGREFMLNEIILDPTEIRRLSLFLQQIEWKAWEGRRAHDDAAKPIPADALYPTSQYPDVMGKGPVVREELMPCGCGAFMACDCEEVLNDPR